jgi:hypothetical protein
MIPTIIQRTNLLYRAHWEWALSTPSKKQRGENDAPEEANSEDSDVAAVN